MFGYRCLPVCPSLVSLDLSGNPAVTSAGLHNILSGLQDGRPPLTLLNLQGTTQQQVSSLTLVISLIFIMNEWIDSSDPCSVLCSCFPGCQVAGPWDAADLDALSLLVQDLRLCSQRLNKLDREALQQTWGQRHPRGYFLSVSSRCLLSAAPWLWGGPF